MKPPAVVFDLDGVLADTLSLIREIDPNNPDLTTFHDGCMTAPVLAPQLRLLQMLHEASYVIILLTHRPEGKRAITEHWLDLQGIDRHHLIMRPKGMFEGWKVGQVQRMTRYYNVRLVLDDDPAIVQALTQAGFPCVYIHSGHYEVPQDHAAYVAQDSEVASR